jgi:hypothetical protein
MYSQQRQPLLGNGSLNTPVARQWLSSRHVVYAMHMHATIEVLLQVVLSVRSVSGLYNEGQLPLPVSLNRV